MGSFSWTRAEHTTRRANLTEGDSYKILVPKEFGGGYIKDTYYDYGYVFYQKEKAEYVDGAGVHHKAEDLQINDLYGILAYWNHAEGLIYSGDAMPQTMLEILQNGNTTEQDNRCKGIDIGCYENQIDKLTYPLKLVSASYNGTYEDCKGKSYGDPNQGFGGYDWNDYDYSNALERLEKLEAVSRSDRDTSYEER